MQTWSIASELQAYKSVPPLPRAVVVLMHGFGEHAGRHRAMLEAFARRDIAVYAYDHRGHGRSPGPPAVVERFDRIVDDSLMIRKRVAALHPDLPLIVLGVSMGGVVAVRGTQRDPSGVAGVVLVAPALMLRGTTPLLQLIGSLIAKFAPAAPIGNLELGALSRDREVVDAYAADPLNYHGAVPARTGVELVAAAASALADAPAWTVPTLIVHGEADRIAAIEGSRRFVTAARSADVTLRAVADAYHEPFTEPGGFVLIDEVADWIRLRERRDADVALAEASSGSAPVDVAPRRAYTWWQGLAFGAAVNVFARMLGTNTGRYEAIKRPWFAPPGYVFPIAWAINSALSIWGNLRVLNAPRSSDRTAYLRLWSVTWLLYLSFGYVFFRRKSPLLGFLVTTNFTALALLSAGRAVRIERRLWIAYATLLPWLVVATAVAGSVAWMNRDPLLDTAAAEPELQIDVEG